MIAVTLGAITVSLPGIPSSWNSRPVAQPPEVVASSTAFCNDQGDSLVVYLTPGTLQRMKHDLQAFLDVPSSSQWEVIEAQSDVEFAGHKGFKVQTVLSRHIRQSQYFFESQELRNELLALVVTAGPQTVHGNWDFIFAGMKLEKTRRTR